MKNKIFQFILFIFSYHLVNSQSLQLDWEFTNFDVPRIDFLKGSKIKTTLDDRIFVSCESQTTYPFFLILNNDGSYEVHKDIDWSFLTSEYLNNYLEYDNVNKLDIGDDELGYFFHNLWILPNSEFQRPMLLSVFKEGNIPLKSNLDTNKESYKKVSSVYSYSARYHYVNSSLYLQKTIDTVIVTPFIDFCMSNKGFSYAFKEFTPITTTPNVKIEPVIFQRVKDSNFVYVMSPTKESAYTPFGFSVRFLEQRWHNEVVVDISKTQLGIPESDMIEATSMDWNNDFIAISTNWYKTNGDKQEFVFVIDYNGAIRSVKLLDETIHCNQVRFSEKGFLVLAGNKKIDTESQKNYVAVYNDRLEFVTDKTWGDSKLNALRDITRAKNANAVVVTGWSGASVYVAQLDLHTISSVYTNQRVELFSIYPNPTKGSITIHWNSPLKVPIDISIVDYIGRVVYEKQQVSSEISFSTNQLPNGLYQVFMKSGSQTYSNLMSVVR